MKLKLLLINLVLFVYNKYLFEDWSLYTKLGKFVIYPFWLVSWVYVSILFPILSLEYFWINSKMYNEIENIKLEMMTNFNPSIMYKK